MSHTIVVTELPNDEHDDPIFTVEGEHDYRCETWWECRKDWHRHPRNLWGELDEWSTKRASEEHQWLEGTWCVKQPGGCGVRVAFENDNYDDEFDRLGTFDVTPEWDGTWFLGSIVYRDTERTDVQP